MSHGAISELQQDQMAGEVSTSEANKDSSVEIPDHERHLVHARIETKTFDQSTGAKLSNPFIQSFYPNEFATMEKDGAFIGKSVEIVHEPEALKKAEKTAVSSLDDPNASKTSKEAEDKKKKELSDKKKADKAEEDAKKKSDALLKKTGGKGVDQNGTPLEKQPRANLLIKYKELWNEDANSEMSDEDLIDAIKDKLPKS